MINKAFLFLLLFFIYGCSGAIRIAEEDKKDSTTPQKNIVVKPTN